MSQKTPQWAVVVIDMQRGYFVDPHLQSARDELLRACNEILAAARLHNVPIWNVVTQHVQDGSTWTINMKQDDQGFLFEGTDEATVVEGLDIEGTHELVKTRDSAFFKTQFEQELRDRGVSHLIVCGVATQNCIMQTAADAYAANFHVVLAGEAIASNNPDAHQPSLDHLEREYRQTIADNKEIVALIAGTVS